MQTESKTKKPRDLQAPVSNLESPPQTPLLSQTDFIIPLLSPKEFFRWNL